MNLLSWTQQPLFGIAATIVVYALSRVLHVRFKWMHPILFCSAVLIGFLVIGNIPLQDYKNGADILALILGPATIALGVPIYKYRELVKKQFAAICLSITCGSIVGIVSVAAIMMSLDGAREVMLSMLPKSVSSPIAVEISKSLGAMPELSAVFTVFTGVVGALFGTTFLRMTGIRGEVPLGIAMGTAAHGFGTAKSLADSEKQGTFSGLAMGLAGLITSILFTPIYMFLM
ncbi:MULTISPECIES: LrgB family protein [Paenibacillus]|uniref:LrgB family protein n=3 Tax=Paenibacillus TaxID=44249 RepID=A0AAJ2JWZ6_9BACL|nr:MULTISPECIES: LrgB family protein [Paenibacillus]EPY13169.1 LrgB family protein [Paenibacillus alvei A6-6i-x]MCY9529870.1 LrgB family protein [Paenibacillus alvei]MDT8977421.1 LrgB family protein [Paenibacillus sp. chi10]TQR46634.1 LrgB family protein [Paenibacillus sp. SDF0028]SDE76968.1 TIGR00659 family protein [Paenibacillus sp. cl6col]